MGCEPWPGIVGKAEKLAKAFGYLTIEEVQALKSLIWDLDAHPRVLNIGAGAGTSGVAIFETRQDVTLITIDQRFEAHALGGLRSEYQALRKAGFLPQRLNYYRQHHGDSRAIGDNWDSDPFDLIFVDDGHLDVEIQGDIQSWMPHLKSGGLMVFDDYVPKGGFSTKSQGTVWEAVARIVDELMDGFEVVLCVDTLKAFRL